MSSLKHTPGPWGFVYGHISGDVMGVFADGTKRRVVNFRGISRPSAEEGRANACLIAAAPEMLDALIALKKAVDPYGTGGGIYNNCRGAMSQCVHAIEKATGMTIDEVLK